MKIAVDIGHNSPPDTGADNIKFEDDLVRQIAGYLIPQLQNMGHEVILTCPKRSESVNHSLNQRCDTANNNDADIFVSLHCNSFDSQSAQGTEVWIANENSKLRDEAVAIANNIAKLGYVNRGVKVGNFRVLTGTNMPALLVESCFVSSQHDIDKFNANDIASAIAYGLMGKIVPPHTPVTHMQEKGTLEVLVNTILKPSPEQASELPQTQCKPIAKGKYGFTLLADEEAHYLVKFDAGFDDKPWYIFHGHCKF